MQQLKSKARFTLPKMRTQKGLKEENPNPKPDNPTTSSTTVNVNPFHFLSKLKGKFQAAKKLPSGSDKKTKKLVHSASKLREVFSRYDTDEDGNVDPAELGQMMRALGGNPTQAEVDKIISKEKLHGPFGFEKFAEVMSRHLKGKDLVGRAKEVQRAFDVMDRDDEGYVNIAELRMLLTTSGEKLDPDEFDEWIKQIGVEPDGKVRYEDVIVTL